MNILFVSCYSLNINNSASIELLYYLNLLSKEQDFNIYLLTMDFPKESIYYDDKLMKILNKNVNIFNVSGGKFLNKFLPQKCKKHTDVEKNHRINSTMIKIKDLINIVDPYVFWSLRAFKYFKNNLNCVDFDYIVGMHEPPSSLICASQVKKYISKKNKNIRLISYFSDPYCNEKSRRNKNSIIKFINRCIEKRVIGLSEGFLFVTKQNLDYYRETYKLDNKDMFLVHRGADSDLYYEIGKEYPEEFIKDKINILYAGDIVKGIRDVTRFVGAIERFGEQILEFNINFYGNINDLEQKRVLEGCKNIKLNSRVSYTEAINLMVNSDLLIIFGNKEFKQVPAKIYDYLGTDAHILIIIESLEDPIIKLVEDIKGVYIVLNDVKTIYSFLDEFKNIFKKEKKINRKYFENDKMLNEFKKVFKN